MTATSAGGVCSSRLNHTVTGWTVVLLVMMNPLPSQVFASNGPLRAVR